MKTMLSKFAGQCTKCARPIARGESIGWSRATGAQHAACCGLYTPPDRNAIVAPCWECQDPAGKFRSYGPASPVYCDACEARIRPTTLDYKLRHNSSSHEDSICGDLAYEDQCAAACGL